MTKPVVDASPWTSVVADWLVICLPLGFEVSGPLGALDVVLGGTIARIRESGDFTGKLAESLTLSGISGIPSQRVVLLGLGETANLSERTLYRAAMTVSRQLSTRANQTIAVALPGIPVGAFQVLRQLQTAATAAVVGSQGQDIRKAERKRFPFAGVRLLVDATVDVTAAQTAVDQAVIVADGVNLARELVNTPACDLYPASFAQRAQQLAAANGVSCTILDEPALVAERMGSLLAVSAGSNQPPRVVCLEYNGAPDTQPRLALIGKGVTFDSGGLSLKPNDSMLTMKCDMAGAATVLAAIICIAKLKLPVRVLALMGLVENMTGGKAMKLGDVLTARSGTTIEVLNTDAEGRLVLADVLDYALSRGCDYLVDLATLTGACVVALGEDISGAMTNNQPWCQTVLSAAEFCGEDLWQLPMHDHFAKLLESDIADMKNVGPRWGGATTAAKFLEKFVKNTPWVHLDIAGPAFASSDKPHREGGGSGCLVRTLVELARRFPPATTPAS